MMEIKSITVKNFKSFVGEHSLDLDRPSGLFFVGGQNLAYPDLGANGAGKSTIFDAIVWCLYGKTSRGIRAGNVQPWKSSEQVSVLLDIFVHGSIWQIHRTWGPVSLRIRKGEESWRNIEQYELDDLVGITYDAFNASVVIGQFSSMFFDLPSSAKLQMFSDLLGLDYWDKKSKLAKDKYKEIERKLSKLETDRAYSEGRIEVLEKQISRSEGFIDEFEGQRKQALEELQDQLKLEIVELQQVKRQFQLSSQQLEKEEETVKSANKKLDQVMEDLHTLEDEVDGIKQDQLVLKRRRTQVLNTMESYRDLEGGDCPTCKQVVYKKHIAMVIAPLEKELSQLELEAEQLREDKHEVLQQIDKVSAYHETIHAELSQARRRVQSIQSEVTRVHSRMAVLEDRVIRIEKEVVNTEQRQNPYEKQLEKDRGELESEQQKVGRILSRINGFEKRADAVSFWVTGFKEIRLFLISEALRFFEIEVNNNLVALGLSDVEVRFDVERDTKSKTVSKGFHVFIKTRDQKEVPWNAWSGGETQRLRLAGTMGLASLVGNDCNIEVYDEPTTHMNQDGIDSLIRVLRDRAVEMGKQIWLIDHHSLDFGGFSGVIQIVKEDAGSKIVEAA